ncbi:uncharacterized protein LOC143288180 [Babylonia areolata]|uniref:uncharacterized protein LOC143288180 n=1 Tax=Babylonia areolata TaxID=304850 RepID=UPI003FD50394
MPNDNGTMPHESSCPQSVAEGVYRALLSGAKLPPLNDSPQLRTALLTFQPSSASSDQHDADVANGNKGEGPGDCGTEDKPACSRESLKAGRGREEGGRRKSATAPSLLMLEALSRRRMDAVRQLHEVCPELLASIPVFDPRPPAEPGTSGTLSASTGPQRQACPIPLNYCHQATPPSHSASASSSVVLTPNTCHLIRYSRLLDLAAENQSMLVFVLQHHPQISKQSRRKRSGTNGSLTRSPGVQAKITKKCDAYDSIGSAHDTCRYHVDDPFSRPTPRSADYDTQGRREHVQGRDEHAQHEGSEPLPTGSENKEDDQKNNGDADLLNELNPNNPITICIRKDNPEVLHYLLFKHVWQHFLLDEVFSLPHNSYVPEVQLGDLLHTCPDCPWFVHCAALMGCVPLLQLVLSGHFCHHHVPSFFSPSTSTGSYAPVPEDAEENCGTGMQSVQEKQEACENHSDILQRGNANSKNIPGITPVNEGLENTTAVNKRPEATVSRDRSPEKQVKDSSSLDQHSSSPASSKTVPPCPRASGSSAQSTAYPASHEHEAASTCPKQRKKFVEISKEPESGSRAHSCSLQQQSVTIPDPNALFPVSLPVMDRWISRCMNVRLSPLHLACWRCDPASIAVLLNQGANVQLLAEELPSPEGQKEDLASSHPSGVDSGESSSIELSLNFVSVTVNTSSMDMGVYSSMEEMLKRAGPPDRQSGLSTLAMLALGIRSPPDFSLSIGKSLGLVLPTLPELWGGQVDRSCEQARHMLLEALQLLLDAGSDVNASCLIFGKSYRVMELFLQPSVDLYYAPLMPRGGRDSAVLRCMDLERVAEIVLSACWELVGRGGRLGPSFCSSLEWNLFRMDWMFLQNEALQRRFLHLAIFLGLFPPLDPALYMGSSVCRLLGRPYVNGASREESQISVNHSAGGVDLRGAHLPPYSAPLPPPQPPRPTCVPWAPSNMTPPSSNSSGSPPRTEEGTMPNVAAAEQVPRFPSQVVTSYYSMATQTDSGEGSSSFGEQPLPDEGVVTPPVSQAHFDTTPTAFRSNNRSSSNPCLTVKRSLNYAGPGCQPFHEGADDGVGVGGAPAAMPGEICQRGGAPVHAAVLRRRGASLSVCVGPAAAVPDHPAHAADRQHLLQGAPAASPAGGRQSGPAEDSAALLQAGGPHGHRLAAPQRALPPFA